MYDRKIGGYEITFTSEAPNCGARVLWRLPEHGVAQNINFIKVNYISLTIAIASNFKYP